MIQMISTVLTVLPAVLAQDVFMPKLQKPAQDVFTPNGTNKSAALAHDGWVFSFHNRNRPTACLDVPGGNPYNGANLEIWECNGQEGQLWYFDSGSFQIVYAGSGHCVDAGDVFADNGSPLFLWDCNGSDQQKWGYDYDEGTIFLSQSAGDASKCMDIAGGSTVGGTAVQAWDCVGVDGQQWEIMSGITIRLGGDSSGLCLDILGGSTDNGTPIEAWECNGLSNQLWIWETGSYQIKLAEDQSKCIDAGGGYIGLMLWDCNSQDQQSWGYDPAMGTIYMTNSADAGLCMDVAGGLLDWGTPIESWDCNGCWNQQFQVIGPASDLSVKTGIGSLVGDDCPPVPSPGPGPGPAPGPGPPPAGNVQDTCANGDGGWPVFNSYDDLKNDGPWSTYFESVYGSIPLDGYPICVGGFWFLYNSKFQAAGISGHNSVGSCFNNDFDHYSKQNSFQPDDGSWIRHSNWQAIPGDTWVEVTHAATSGEKHGLWAMYAPGSGMWISTGTTQSWGDHSEGVKAMNCATPNFDDLAPCAEKLGYDTIQFLQHIGNGWNCPNYHTPLNIEIVIVKASGQYACGDSGSGSPFRAGWNAQLDCNCNENGASGNCGATQISPR